jgi:predicted lipoprotein with Yx(FWY)xxD motif
MGRILVDSHGMALYANNVETTTSTLKCIGECATEWPPLMVTGAVPKELAGIKGTFTLVPRPGSGKQLALNGHPLYTFDEDKSPGMVHGNGFVDNGRGTTLTWHVVTPSGVVIKPTVKPSVSPR